MLTPHDCVQCEICIAWHRTYVALANAHPTRTRNTQNKDNSYMAAHTQMKGNPREANTDEGAYTQPRARRNEETKDKESACRIFHDKNKLMEFTSHILFMLFDRVVGSLQHIGGKFWRAGTRPYENPGWCEATRDRWRPIFTGEYDDHLWLWESEFSEKLRRP